MRYLALLSLFALTACLEPVSTPPAGTPQSVARNTGSVTPSALSQVASRVIPVAVDVCQARNVRRCDFQLGLDSDPNAPPNAFQTEDSSGRPQLIFTTTLLDELSNIDELAFIMAHEAAHHIEGHLAETNQNAQIGAVVGGLLATVLGADVGAAETAVRAGAMVGSRRYSKDFELEADALGARITERAGYDALRGAVFFTRIPDPGDVFLGSHPPNAERIEKVRETVGAI